MSRNPKEDLRKEIPVGKEADDYTYEVTVTAPDGTKIIAKDTPEDLVIEQPSSGGQTVWADSHYMK